ncbi:hypothetical protein HZA96_02785 [Candidatus Woesearchaeota archaeon]|nr:hypothetical protein [Candidatus Woesearchaeota archaeon]
MGWFEKFKEKFSKPFNINLENISVSLFRINIIKDNNNKSIIIHNDSNNLSLNLANLPSQYKKELSEIVRDYLDEKNILLENNTNDLLIKLYQYNKECSDKAILNFFKLIMNLKDYEALEASLFLRKEFRSGIISGKPIINLKADIRKRFGDRGNNIANLCTAGYFEQFLMQLYNDAQKEVYNQIYEEIVNNSIVAVFVHTNMTEDEIPEQITNKINISKRYGIKFIHIHGIGKMNILKIKKCIEQEKKYFSFFDKKIYETENIIIVELIFN